MPGGLTVGLPVCLVAVGFVLEMNRDRMARNRIAVGAAAVNRQAVVKTDLALFQRQRNLHDLSAFSLKLFPQAALTAGMEVSEIFVVSPPVALIDDHQGPHRFIAILKWDPGRQHIGRTACLPISPVSMPADTGLATRLVRRFKDHLIV